jgi:cytochrome c oxidase cbb3-type subunit 3
MTRLWRLCGCGLIACSLAAAGCERETRSLQPDRAVASVARGSHGGGVHIASDDTMLFAPATTPFTALERHDERRAYDVSQGKRLFSAYNCSGCHAHGGGGMGPALMDERWSYGSDPDSIYRSIVRGRPNGMPSFSGRIPEYEVWELVAYVRSMSGLTSQTAASGRGDEMRSRARPANSRPQDQPTHAGGTP